jgi:hypothetical protein
MRLSLPDGAGLGRGGLDAQLMPCRIAPRRKEQYGTGGNPAPAGPIFVS